jgi:hypothetical protein
MGAMETQFTSFATSEARNRSSLPPTMTRCERGSVAMTYSGSGAAMPRPLRWPTVKWWTPACSPMTSPSVSTISPAVCWRLDALLAEVGVDEGGVVAVGDETDLLGVVFGGDADAEFRGERAHLGLGHAAERKQRAGELFLPDAEQEVGLVLAEVHAAAQAPAAFALVEIDAGVVAGGDVAGAEAVGHLEELVELDVVVAERAGDGRAAGEVLVDEGLTTSRSKRSSKFTT